MTPNDKMSLMVGVYNGDPAGPNCTGDPQLCDDNGLDFRLDSPPLLMVEGAYKYNQKEGLPVLSKSVAGIISPPLLTGVSI